MTGYSAACAQGRTMADETINLMRDTQNPTLLAAALPASGGERIGFLTRLAEHLIQSSSGRP